MNSKTQLLHSWDDSIEIKLLRCLKTALIISSRHSAIEFYCIPLAGTNFPLRSSLEIRLLCHFSNLVKNSEWNLTMNIIEGILITQTWWTLNCIFHLNAQIKCNFLPFLKYLDIINLTVWQRNPKTIDMK